MRIVTPLVAFLLVVGALLALPAVPAEAATTKIPVSGTIGQTWFCSSTYQNGSCPTTISVGDTVQWNFNGDVYSAHSTRHCSDGCDGTPSGTPQWDSPIAAVQTYSYTFNTPGTYPYQCEVHPLNMQGEITVVSGVGGVAELPDVAPVAAEQPLASDGNAALIAGIAVAAAGLLVSGAAAVYAVRRVRR